MEERESILEALQREVKEEAGIDCQPITLLMVQEQGPKWVRFIFLAEETGLNQWLILGQNNIEKNNGIVLA